MATDRRQSSSSSIIDHADSPIQIQVELGEEDSFEDQDGTEDTNEFDSITLDIPSNQLLQRYGTFAKKDQEDQIEIYLPKGYVPIGTMAQDGPPERLVMATLDTDGMIVVCPINMTGNWQPMIEPRTFWRWKSYQKRDIRVWNTMSEFITFETFNPKSLDDVKASIIRQTFEKDTRTARLWGWRDMEDLEANTFLHRLHSQFSDFQSPTGWSPTTGLSRLERIAMAKRLVDSAHQDLSLAARLTDEATETLRSRDIAALEATADGYPQKLLQVLGRMVTNLIEARQMPEVNQELISTIKELDEANSGQLL